jgi:hypothetical protein
MAPPSPTSQATRPRAHHEEGDEDDAVDLLLLLVSLPQPVLPNATPPRQLTAPQQDSFLLKPFERKLALDVADPKAGRALPHARSDVTR